MSDRLDSIPAIIAESLHRAGQILNIPPGQRRVEIQRHADIWAFGDRDELGAVTRNYPFISHELQRRLARSTVCIIGEQGFPTAMALARLGIGFQRIHNPGLEPSSAGEVWRISPLSGACIYRKDYIEPKVLLEGRTGDKRTLETRLAKVVIDTSLDFDSEKTRRMIIEAQEVGVPYLMIQPYGLGVRYYLITKDTPIDNVEQAISTFSAYSSNVTIGDISEMFSPIGEAIAQAIAITYVTRLVASDRELEDSMLSGNLFLESGVIDTNILSLVLKDNMSLQEFSSRFSQLLQNPPRVLVAGLGAGSPVAHILASLRIPLRVIDPDIYSRENLSRQWMDISNIGIPKVQTFTEYHADSDIEAIHGEVTSENILPLLKGCACVIDMIDINLPNITLLLHQTARNHGIPSITGLDAGWTPIVFAFSHQYTMEGQLGLPNGVDPSVLEDEDPIHIILTQMGENIPIELQLAVHAFQSGEISYGPQLGATSLALGAIQAVTALANLMNLATNDTMAIDLMDWIQTR